MKSGDIIGFAGRGFVSNLIQVGTFSLPNRGISHVGVVCYSNGIPFVYESTSFGRPACEIQKVKVSGVQCHRLENLLDFVDNQNIWHYPLQRELYEHEERRLGYYLDRKLGVPYDYFGAGRSGGFAWNLLQTALHNEDLSNIFCSELIADAFSDLGIFTTLSSSRWNPNKLLRRLYRRGIVHVPQLLKRAK